MRQLVAAMLLCGWAGIVHAGDLGMAGALSGAGQGLANGLSTMQAIMGQQALQEQYMRNESLLVEQRALLEEGKALRGESGRMNEARVKLRMVPAGAEREKAAQAFDQWVADYNDRLDQWDRRKADLLARWPR